ADRHGDAERTRRYRPGNHRDRERGALARRLPRPAPGGSDPGTGRRDQPMKNRLLPGLALRTLAGCASSPPTRYFALDPTPAGASPAADQTAATGTPVKVDAVHIPPALDRDAMGRGESDNSCRSPPRTAGPGT